MYIIRGSGPNDVILNDIELNTRSIYIYSILGVYVLFAAATTAVVIYRHTHSKDELLAKRSIPLVAFQVVVGTAVGAAALAATALHEFPCALKLWIISLGVLLWLLAVAVRGAQHLLLARASKTHSAMSQQEPLVDCASASRTNAGASLEPPFYYNGALEDPYRPNTAQTLDVWSEFGGNTTRQSQGSLSCIHETQATACLHTRLRRLVRAKTLVTSLVLVAALLIIYTTVVSTRSTAYSIHNHAPHASCMVDDGWEIWLPYGIAMMLIAPVFLALEVAIWMVCDVYNTRTDIFACMVSSQIALVIYALWVTVLQDARVHLSEMFFVWVAMLAAHMSSICWPLLCSIKRQKQLAAQPPQSGFGHPYRETRLRRSAYSPLYKEFQSILEDGTQRKKFLRFATHYYRSGLPLFLSDYQLLKYQVIEALHDTRNSACADNPQLTTHLNIDRFAVQMVKDDQYPHESHPMSNLVPITKGIFESAMLLLPPATIDDTTQFPEAVKSAFSSFICTYFGRESYMSISIPGEVVAEIQKAVELSNVTLSILDRAKDEVLFVLCTDVFIGYRKRLEAQGCRLNIS